MENVCFYSDGRVDLWSELEVLEEDGWMQYVRFRGVVGESQSFLEWHHSVHATVGLILFILLAHFPYPKKVQ
jgi:hypothetical protein